MERSENTKMQITRDYYDRPKTICFILMLGTLLLGAVFYYYFCPDVYFVKCVDAITKWNIHYYGNDKWDCIIQIIRNYGMDFIWAFAFLNGMLFFSPSLNLKAIVLITITLGSILELMQYSGVITGTFDVLDIVAETAGVFLAVNIKNKNRRRT